MIKKYTFDSFEAYEESDAIEKYDALALVDADGWKRADIMAHCKRWQTAVKRFFEGIGNDSTFYGWKECIVESCENGYFSMNDFQMADGSRNEFPSWSYGVEQLNDETWYVFLNVRKEI